MADAVLEVFRGNQRRRKRRAVSSAHRPRNGGARCAALRSGASGARSRGALELQSRQVRLLLGGGEWPPSAHLQDAHGLAAHGQAHHHLPMKAFPVIKDLVTDVSWNYKVNRKIPPFQPAQASIGRCTSRTSIACRNFASALNAFSARTSATCCAITTRRRSSAVRASSCGWPRWRCIRWTTSRAPGC